VSPAADAGRFGEFGGVYVPETLLTPVLDLAAAYEDARRDPSFQALLESELRDFAGRPTPLLPVPSFARASGLARVLLKREDLLHTGAHKINNAIGQALLARRAGKTRVVAETGATGFIVDAIQVGGTLGIARYVDELNEHTPFKVSLQSKEEP